MGLKTLKTEDLLSATQRYYKDNPGADTSSLEGKTKACLAIYTDLTGETITDSSDTVTLLNMFGTTVTEDQAQILQAHLPNVETTGAAWIDCIPFLW